MASNSASKGLEFEWQSFLGKLAEIASLRTRNLAGWDWATEIEVSIMMMACRKAGYHPSSIPQNFKQAVAIGPVAHQYSRIARLVLLVAGHKEIAQTWEAADAKLHLTRKRQILLAEGADAILAKIMQTATKGQQDVAKQGARERLPLPGIGSEHVLEGLMQQFEELSVMCGPLAGSEPMEEDGTEDQQDKKRRRMEITEPAVPSTPSLAVATPITGGAGAGTAVKAGRVVESDGDDDGEDDLDDDDWADGGWSLVADNGPAAAAGTLGGGDAAESDDLLLGGSNSREGGPRSTRGGFGFGTGFSMGASFDEAVKADEMRESIRAVLRLREPEDARPKALASGSAGGAPVGGPSGSGVVGQSGAGAGGAAEGKGTAAPQVDVRAQEAARVRREAAQKEAEAKAAREAARMQRQAEESDPEDEYDDEDELFE